MSHLPCRDNLDRCHVTGKFQGNHKPQTKPEDMVRELFFNMQRYISRIKEREPSDNGRMLLCQFKPDAGNAIRIFKNVGVYMGFHRERGFVYLFKNHPSRLEKDIL